MPKAKDAKRKRRQRKAPETTASRDSNDVRKGLSGGKSVSSLWLQSCRQEGLSRFRKCQEQARSRESGSIKQRCREKEMSRTETSKRSRSRRPVPARRSAAVPIGSPLSLLSKLPSPGLPGLYLYILYIYIYDYMCI